MTVTDAGLIDFLIGSHVVAESLRRCLIFKLVPMVAADGVFCGNHRQDSLTEPGSCH